MDAPIVKRVTIPTTPDTYEHVRDILRKAKEMTAEHGKKIDIQAFDNPDSFQVKLTGVPQIVTKLAAYFEHLRDTQGFPEREKPKYGRNIARGSGDRWKTA